VCGRYVIRTSPQVIADFFEVEQVPQLTPRFNVAPSQQVPIVRRNSETQQREVSFVRWGLLPFWAKDEKIAHKMINAKSETVAIKPAFRRAFLQRRCLVVADGFYEWKKHPGSKVKTPYFIFMKEQNPFAFAGLWESWTSQSNPGEIIESCTILTTNASGLVSQIHDRMPVILAQDTYESWLSNHAITPDELTELAKSGPAELLDVYAVSTLVNGPKNDEAACIAKRPRLLLKKVS